MPISAEGARAVALYSIGQNRWPDHVDGLGVLNRAGRWMTSARSWSYLDHGEALLSLTASQDYVLLPVDCAAVKSVRGVDGFERAVELVTQDALSEARSHEIDPPGFLAAVSQLQGDDGAPRMRLELAPTPSATEANVLRLRYTRDWADFTEDHQRASIPEFMVDLYLEAVRAQAGGEFNEAQGTLGQRRIALLNDATFAVAVRRDGAAQMSFGRITGGAAQTCSYGMTSRYYRRGGIGLPS